jgi:hypothetical protein
MKTIKLLFVGIITGMFFTACTVVYDDLDNDLSDEIYLESVVSEYDLWYIDYHRTTGVGDIPFLSRAFTITFRNGILYANNNIVDIGRTGNGLGISVGTYDTYQGILGTNHDIDGFHDFEVTQLSVNEIRLYNYRENVSYYLIGYQKNNFDYDKLFYENIEYFLQEFKAWEKIATAGGTPNAFDAENYLQFTPENTTTFYSSQDAIGIDITGIDWSYVGSYEVFDVRGYEDLKIVTLTYDEGDVEEFELSVLNDETISLYHINSETTYEFFGRGFIQYLKGGKASESSIPSVRNSNRKRTKIARNTKSRRNLK